MSTSPNVDRSSARSGETLVTITMRLPASFVGRAMRAVRMRRPSGVRLSDALLYAFELGLLSSESLAFDSPFPLTDVLRKLIDSTDHLLHVHDCDHIGHEGRAIARDEARIALSRLEALLQRSVSR